MQSLYICSDVHGDFYSFRDFVRKAGNNPILVLGDFCPDSEDFEKLLKQHISQLTLVRGNCDSGYDYAIAGIPVPPLLNSLTFAGRLVILTHGHHYRRPSDLPIHLKPGDVFFSGHTHREQLFIDGKGIINANPGSLAYPRGKCGASYIVMNEQELALRELYGGNISTLTLPMAGR
ncbi:MAG: metallophosphoesterase family protein [Spirochaetia bacterium]|jgi:putative phosphoesterase|nr:metallophosphoesterase family protein [Spirochaetia bacterium]